MYEQEPLPGLEDSMNPLDESDHRPRHDRDGSHWTWRRVDLWCEVVCQCPDGRWKLPDIHDSWGPLTLCDCPPVVD
jgi:hypothetical protein